MQGDPGSTCVVGVLGSELDPKGPAARRLPGTSARLTLKVGSPRDLQERAGRSAYTSAGMQRARVNPWETGRLRDQVAATSLGG